MLKSRVITSLILTALIVTAILALPAQWFGLVLALLVLGVGGWEGARLAGLRGVAGQSLWLAGLLSVAALIVWQIHVRTAIAPVLFAASSLVWLVLAGWLRVPGRGRPVGDAFQPGRLALIGALLAAGYIAVLWLHVQSPWLVIELLLIVAAADIGAYFAGSSLGGAKLAPAISPGKTWSGAIGGLIVATLIAPAAGRWLPGIELSPVALAVAAVLLASISIVGDLMFSLFKRHRGLKDTSNLLPGHGGMLDRIDSLTAAAPLFALIAWWLQSG